MAVAFLILHAVGGRHIGSIGRRSGFVAGQQVAVLAVSGVEVPLAALLSGAVVEQGGLGAVDDSRVNDRMLAVGGAALSAGPDDIADLDVLGVVGLHSLTILGGRCAEGDHGVAQLCQHVCVLHAGPAAGAAGVFPGSQCFLEADGIAGVGVLVPVQGSLDDGILCRIRALGV